MARFFFSREEKPTNWNREIVKVAPINLIPVFFWIWQQTGLGKSRSSWNAFERTENEFYRIFTAIYRAFFKYQIRVTLKFISRI